MADKDLFFLGAVACVLAASYGWDDVKARADEGRWLAAAWHIAVCVGILTAAVHFGLRWDAL